MVLSWVRPERVDSNLWYFKEWCSSLRDSKEQNPKEQDFKERDSKELEYKKQEYNFFFNENSKE